MDITVRTYAAARCPSRYLRPCFPGLDRTTICVRHLFQFVFPITLDSALAVHTTTLRSVRTKSEDERREPSPLSSCGDFPWVSHRRQPERQVPPSTHHAEETEPQMEVAGAKLVSLSPTNAASFVQGFVLPAPGDCPQYARSPPLGRKAPRG